LIFLIIVFGKSFNFKIVTLIFFLELFNYEHKFET
jgi:hypothetical protein